MLRMYDRWIAAETLHKGPTDRCGGRVCINNQTQHSSICCDKWLIRMGSIDEINTRLNQLQHLVTRRLGLPISLRQRSCGLAFSQYLCNWYDLIAEVPTHIGVA